MRLPHRVLAALLLLSLPADLGAQTGLLVIAHGAGPEWNEPIREVTRQVAWPHGPVATGFLMGAEAESAGWDAAVRQLVAEGAREIIVVPLMVSSYGSHYRQVEHYAGARPELPAELLKHDHRSHPAPVPVPTLMTPALDASPELGVALALRWQSLSEADRKRPLVFIAHGPSGESDLAHWAANLRAAARVLEPLGVPGVPPVGLLRDDAAPEVRAEAVRAIRDTISALARAAGDSVVVMPLLLSTSKLSQVKVPADLEGLPVRYTRTPLAPLPPLARWIERVAEERRLALSLARTD